MSLYPFNIKAKKIGKLAASTVGVEHLIVPFTLA